VGQAHEWCQETVVESWTRYILSQKVHFFEIIFLQIQDEYLKKFEIKCCTLLQSINDSLETLVSLEQICITDCTLIKALPNIQSTLLKTLDMRDCYSLVSIPELENFNHLIEIDFSYCTSLQSLPKSYENLPLVCSLRVEDNLKKET